MKKNTDSILRQKIRWNIVAIFVLGIVLRFIFLGEVPVGLHQDEVYSGYEAFALLKEGMDSHGYTNPVYFISWGHGMNALYAYLSMPFIWTLGLNVVSIRLMQAILGSITLLLFYGLLKDMHEEKTAVLGILLLAINPWHIMLSRWGLEANIAPFFILAGVFFLVKAIQKNSKYYIPAGIFWGLSLYCYAILWIFVPLFLFFIFLYELRYKILKINRFLVAGVLLLGTIGVPLVWFFFLNKGILPEICTEFFSIPQMDSMRAAEVSIREFPENIKNLIKVLLFQKDSMLHNSPSVGIYYYCSIPFMVIGGLTALYQFICNWKNKELKTADIMILWCLAAGIVGGLIHEVNVNRINCIHLVVIYFSAYGCSLCVKVSTQKFANNHIVKNILSSIIAGIYIVSFGFFYKEYYYDRTTDFYYGYEDALDYAESITEGKIGTVLIRYPLLFMHSEMLPSEYVEELGYIKNYDTIDEIGRYVIEPKPEEMKSDIVYVVPKYLEEEYLPEGYISVFDNERYVVIQSSF